MKKTLVVTTALLAAAALAACGAEDPADTGTDQNNTSNDTGSEENTDSTDETGLKDAYEYEDGLVVTLSDFERGTSSEYAVPADTPYVKFTVTVENGTGAEVDLSLLLVDCKTGEDGKAAESVFDDGIGEAITGVAKDGKKASGEYACELGEDETALQVEVNPNDELSTTAEFRDPAVFAGEVEK